MAQYPFLKIHAKKSSRERIIFGRVRDVDTVVSGSKGKFEVQLHAGIWDIRSGRMQVQAEE